MNIFLFFLFLGFSRSATASECNSPATLLTDRDFKSIQKFVDSNQFSSIECLLAALPRDILGFRAYVTSSLSLQEASLENPRVLLGAPHGEAFFTFNGSPTQKGFENVEFIAVDNAKTPTAWLPGEISVVNGKLVVNSDSASCVKCHGNPVRPIWAEYNHWPNTFGSIDDWMPLDDSYKGTEPFEQDFSGGRIDDVMVAQAKLEAQQFLKYKQTAQSHSRYSIIEAVTDPANSLFPFTTAYRARNVALRANLNMGSAMAIMQNKILYGRLMKSTLVKQFPVTLLYQAQCPIEDDERAKIEEALTSGNPQNAGKKVLDLAGISRRDLTLDFLLDGSNVEGYFAGGAAVDPEGALLRDYIHLHNLVDYMNVGYEEYYLNPPELPPEIQSKRFFYDSIILDNHYSLFVNYNAYQVDIYLPGDYDQATGVFTETARIELCKKLKVDSDVELAGAKFTEPVQSEVIVKNPWPAALNSCVECHDSRPLVARAIPFSDRAKLAAMDIAKLVESVEIMTNPEKLSAHEGGNRMPLGRKALTEQERADIINWIRSK